MSREIVGKYITKIPEALKDKKVYAFGVKDLETGEIKYFYTREDAIIYCMRDEKPLSLFDVWYDSELEKYIRV